MPYSDTDKIKLPIIHNISISIFNVLRKNMNLIIVAVTITFSYSFMNMINIMLIIHFLLNVKLVLYKIVIKVFMYLNYN